MRTLKRSCYCCGVRRYCLIALYVSLGRSNRYYCVDEAISVEMDVTLVCLSHVFTVTPAILIQTKFFRTIVSVSPATCYHYRNGCFVSALISVLIVHEFLLTDSASLSVSRKKKLVVLLPATSCTTNVAPVLRGM